MGDKEEKAAYTNGYVVRIPAKILSLRIMVVKKVHRDKLKQVN